ncbi:MAG: hypothetical protein GX580_11315 [Candidatus Hydrogenedens sp.]|nr:hypothetical protein [Candidatus Hydrogenedentota bacterium]NLF58216.1 hypothetical protein [Candidatus Hydrogenedens sp.]
MSFLGECKTHRRRQVRPVGHTVFQGARTLFYATVFALLVLFAVALVHELIPGLCLDNDGGNCPFCKLVHSLTLTVQVLLFFACGALARRRLCGAATSPMETPRFPRFLLRAPPAL